MRVLDLCCCEGGVSRGLALAGFQPYGIDLFEEYSQKRYPYPSLKADALDALARLILGEALAFTHPDGTVEWLTLSDFALLHGSPPCQKYSVTNHNGRDYPDLIGPIRDLFILSGLRYTIENVVGAPLLDPVELCGCMFDLKAPDADGVMLRLERARLFESNVPLHAPGPHNHDGPEWVAGCYGGARKAKRHEGETLAEVAPRDRHEARYVRKGGYVPRSKAVAEALLGIDWMTWKGLHQSIPPVYTQYLGQQLTAHIINERSV